MKTITDPKIMQLLQRFSTIQEEAWLVGGCVRDMLMERELHDYDITTSAPPDVVIKLFQSAGYRVVPTGLKHGTVTVLADKEPVEITTYRTESGYIQHRKPQEVSFTRSLDEDLKRRDFTMNAIAWHPVHGFHDPFHGREDIEKKCIRCVGNASLRMKEDALRILRALRFHCTLQFSLEEATIQAIRTHAQLLSCISKECIREEFNRIVLQDYPNTLLLLKDMHVLDEILKGYTKLMCRSQNNPWHIYDLLQHTDIALNHTAGYPLESKLAVIFHDTGKPQCEQIDADGISHYYGHAKQSVILGEQWMKELRYDKKTIRTVLQRIAFHDYQLTPRRAVLRRYLSKFDNDVSQALLAMDVQLADQQAKNPIYAEDGIKTLTACRALLLSMQEEEQLLSLRTLAVNGTDLLTCGFQGAQIGSMLKKLLEYAIEDPSRNTRDQLLAKAKEEKDALR